MIKLLFNFLGGSVADKLIEAYKIRANAKTDEDKLLANQRIAVLEAKQAIILQEHTHWSTRWIRPVIALPFAVYINKVVIWDKVLGLGTTEPLSPQFAEIMFIVLGAYFVGRSVEKIATKFFRK